MASSNDDVPIKYESPYPSDTIPQFSSQSPTLKRRLSDEPDDMGEKRQRVDSGTAEPEFDLAAILAQATADATEAIQRGTPEGRGDTDQNLLVSQDDEKEVDEHPTLFMSDPHLSMRILSLPILESLSTQILSTLAQGPYSETIKIVTVPDSEFGQAYTTLKNLFEQTKKIYSQQAPFLSADELNIHDPKHRGTIRTTNLATFVSSVFGGQDVGFYELDSHFIQTFTPDGMPFGQEPGQLFLNFKTQMYLSAVSQEEPDKSAEDTLDDLFPLDLEAKLKARHPETDLTSNELEFIEGSKARRDYLMNQPSDVDSIQTLSEEFAWEHFLQRLSKHLSEAYEPLIAPYMKRHALTAPASPVRPLTQKDIHDQQNSHNSVNAKNVMEDDIFAQAELAAEAALQSLGLSFNQYQQQPQQNGGPPPHMYKPPAEDGGYQSQYGGDNVPYPTQSAPTQVLYEQARQAAVAKANPGNARRPGLPSQRRPWSTDEENALMAGLDQVKGPHWSQILALYGPKGSLSEVLKDRNQVQLKDKARNLKLFFLKSNIEVPYYLQCVTGELKTRAPSQAARKEAEERARLASEDEQARYHGIMALANGMQQNPQPVSQYENVQAQIPEPSHQQPQGGLNSPEEFQVVEPESRRGSAMEPTHPQVDDDEHFRQRLIAASAADDGMRGIESIAF